ncbi:prepilin peptidase [Microbacterium halotolerans]|uniref:prepilin peptidase n=1 Tax=Microbacterium halotolerans TaxID=246613 RepID=UPI000E6ABCEB|nr:prepilin peptidase [Microbacterium halotolerans]
MDRTLVALAYMSFTCVALMLIRSDMVEHRLPNRVVLPGTAVIAALLAGASVTGGGLEAIARAVLGASVLCAFYLVLWGAGGGMGGGDVKLAVLVGFFLAWHGWSAFGIGAAAAFVLGGAAALVLVTLRRATRRTRIAFGPFMLLGACIGPLLG